VGGRFGTRARFGQDGGHGFIGYPERSRDQTVVPWHEERLSIAGHPSRRFRRVSSS
jgi:hypothetical protein